jgi:hypothetical protein
MNENNQNGVWQPWGGASNKFFCYFLAQFAIFENHL